MQRKLKRMIALAVIVAVFGVGIAKPRTARASTTDDVIIGVAGFAVYIGIIVILTKFVFNQDDKNTATIEDPLATYEQNDGSVKTMQRCRQQGAEVTLACW